MNTTTLLIGRCFTADRLPIEGSGVLLERNSPTARLLLAQRDTVIIANPITREYGAAVWLKNKEGEAVLKGLGIIPPASVGPPPHIHPNYDETFTVLEGCFDFLLNGKTVRIAEGETMVVKKGTAHTFKPAANNRVCSFLLEANPPGKLNEVIRTIWGLALDGKTNSKGQPSNFFQGIAIGHELADDTLFVSPPPFIQRALFKLLGKTATKKGYKGIYDTYSADDFWRKRVEQLDTQPA
jgi:quercetin dioxygenase-like cupin family protein